MSQQELIDGLHTKLTAAQGAGTLYAAVGGRIYQLQGPQNLAMPWLVFTVVTDVPARTFTKDNINPDIQFDLYGERYLGANALTDINDKLWTLLDRSTFSITGHNSISMAATERGILTVEDRAYRIRSEWTLFANNNN